VTHSDLVEHGRKWLASQAPIVVTEISSGASEEPDVIAFSVSRYNLGRGTILLECKVSRQDFLGDQKKPYRRDPRIGMGNYRYYLAPAGLIKCEELPEKWGLLEAHQNGGIKIIKKAEWQETNSHREVILLCSVLRRLKIAEGGHVSIKKYAIKTKNKATLTIGEIE
jgi:hypothetical protein